MCNIIKLIESDVIGSYSERNELTSGLKGGRFMGDTETIQLQGKIAMPEYDNDLDNLFDQMVKKGLASTYLEGMGVSEKQIGRLPDLILMEESLNKVRVAFRNKIEPAVVSGEFTMVTFSLVDFAKTCGILRGILSDITK
jgi:hypothetical protein